MEDIDEWSRSAVLAEFAGVHLGDKRRESRLVTIVKDLSSAPSKSLPDAVSDDAALEGLYRFLSNESVSPASILEPHIARTFERAANARVALAIHDTSECEFGGKKLRKNLHRLRSEHDQGFLAHVTLLASVDGIRLPYGVAAMKTWTRTKFREKPKGRTKRSGAEYAALDGKESDRWNEQIVQVERQPREHELELIHVGDRETDNFVLIRDMLKSNRRFVFRSRLDRVAGEAGSETIEHLSNIAARATAVATIEVDLCAKPISPIPLQRKAHPGRDARIASVTFSAARVRLKRPRYVRDGEGWIELNAVFVREPNPPEGATPVDWTLFTSEPIDTPEQIAQIVTYYRSRWLIEEFFKAIKTGCSYEKNQLESYEALLNLFAIYIPIAVQMLVMRTTARTAPDSPGSAVASPTQIKLLRASLRRGLPATPSAREVLLAVAALGGHVGRREPGWLVIARGYEKLAIMISGWNLRAATEM